MKKFLLILTAVLACIVPAKADVAALVVSSPASGKGYTGTAPQTPVQENNKTPEIQNVASFKFNDVVNSTDFRIYANSSFTITPNEGVTITKIVFNDINSKSPTITSTPSGISTTSRVSTWEGSVIGPNTLTVKTTAQLRITYIEITYTPAVGDDRTPVTLSWNPTSASATLGQDFTAPILTADPEAALSEVKYESSKPEIASIAADGTVTLGTKGGSTTITAAIEGSETYKDAKAEYVLTVTDPNAKNYTLITSTDNLYDGATGIILGKSTNKTNAMGVQSGTYRAETSVSIDGDEITDPQNAAIVTFHKVGDNYTLEVEDGKYLSYSGSGNSINTGTTQANATITIASDGKATIKFVGSRAIYYNPSASRFACYTSSQNGDIYLYIMPNASGKEVAGLSFATPSYTINEGEAFTAPTIENPNNIEGITYGSDAPEVADVDPATGAVTIKGVGTATITATSTETDKYLAGKASYTIVVKGVASTLAEFIERASEGIVPSTSGVVEGTVELVANFPMTVTFVNGANIYVTDGETYCQIFQYDLNPSYAAGDVIPAGWSGKISIYRGNTIEITSVTGNQAATENKPVKPAVVESISADMINQYVMVYNVEFATGTTASGTIDGALGAETVSCYNPTGIEAAEAGYYEVQGVVRTSNDGLQIVLSHLWAMPEKPVFTPGGDLTEWPSALQEGMVLTWTVKYGTISYVDNNQQASEVAAYAADENGWEISADGKTATYTVPAGTKAINYSIINTVNGVKSSEAKLIVGEDGSVSGVQDVFIENAPAVYYNLQGVRVEGDLTPGLYIRRSGNTTTKVIVR